MNKKIKKAGVIGAGVMGATIAAHIANVGIEVILLDIVPPELTVEDKKKGYTKQSKAFRNKFAKNGLDTALKSKPASFYVAENAKLITIGNMEDDLEKLEDVDWIIEVVVERLDIKKKVFEKISKRFGISLDELNREHTQRSRLLNRLKERRIFDFNQVQKIINEYHKNPDAILHAFGVERA